MARTDTYGKLRIEERNGILTAQFRRIMKYGKLINGSLDIKEVEQGVEVNGMLSEQEIVEMGYKPFCETEQTDENAVVKYTEYETCIVQEWIAENVEGYEE